ncbi:MAG: hypothetical protein EOO20_17695 [Chryseobacterium sp.]|nr:MAG: hypothetical protein EOO20_17695 [Chryseobacterium sp.]
MRTGTIATIDPSRGCGIIVDENDQEIPFFFKNDDDSLDKSMKVNFEIQLTPAGLAAVRVELHGRLPGSG